MSLGIFSVTIIASRLATPISVATFPSMETCQPVWSGDQPDITGSQIEILISHQTDVFYTIPSISVRNHHWTNLHRWGNYHRRRKLNRWHQQPYLPVRLNHTP